MVQPESDHRGPEQPGRPLNPQPPTAPQTVELDRQAAELAALRRVLSASRGTFSLSVAICNSPALRDYLIGRLSADSPGIQVLTLPAGVEDVFDHARANSPPAERTALFLVNLEASLRSDQTEHAVLRALNASREPWRTSVACPVVFWLPEFAATLLSVHARDFWAWCSHRLEFVSEDTALAGGSMEQSSAALDAVGNLDVDRKHFRVAELQRRLKEAGNPPPPEMAEHVATWLNELGFLHFRLGDWAQAEVMLQKALAIREKLGRLAGVANAYGNLAQIHQTRGDLDEAERMYRKALEIDENLGRLNGMAIWYGNLGVLHKTRGDLDEAVRMHRKALEIDEKLGSLEGIAAHYGNLGLIHRTRGDLDEAERMHRKALEMNEKLGRLVGMASAYAALALVHQARGDLDDSERMHHNALEIEEKLGRLEGMARQYCNLGTIHQTRGDLGEAERMLRKALEIHEQLGHREGMASDYANLASVQAHRGDIAGARELGTKARNLYARIGMPQMVTKLQGWLDGLPPSEGGEAKKKRGQVDLTRQEKGSQEKRSG